MRFSGMVYRDVELRCGCKVVVEADYDQSGEDFTVGIYRHEDGEDITAKLDTNCHEEFEYIESVMAEAIVEDVAEQMQERAIREEATEAAREDAYYAKLREE